MKGERQVVSILAYSVIENTARFECFRCYHQWDGCICNRSDRSVKVLREMVRMWAGGAWAECPRCSIVVRA